MSFRVISFSIFILSALSFSKICSRQKFFVPLHAERATTKHEYDFYCNTDTDTPYVRLGVDSQAAGLQVDSTTSETGVCRADGANRIAAADCMGNYLITSNRKSLAIIHHRYHVGRL